KRLDFADLDAVEAYARAGGKAGHRAVEHDVVPLAAAGEIAQPEYEDESERQHAEHEPPDHQIVSLGFHQTGSSTRDTFQAGILGRSPGFAARARSPQKYSSIHGWLGWRCNSVGEPVRTIFLSASTATLSHTVKMVSRSWVTI